MKMTRGAEAQQNLSGAFHHKGQTLSEVQGQRSKGFSARACPPPVLVFLEDFKVFLLPQLNSHFQTLTTLPRLLTGPILALFNLLPSLLHKGCPPSSGLLTACPFLVVLAAVGSTSCSTTAMMAG